ncbi:MAG: sulfurtransferase TusA family protein [Gemmataceae bacterium]
MNDTETSTVDARGLNCPQPVIATRQAILGRDHGSVTVLVDTGTQRDNVARLARREGWTVEVESTDESFRIQLSK